MTRETIIIAGTSVFSTAIGAAAGFYYAKKRLNNHYVAIAEQEIADAKEFYSVLNKKGDFESPAQAVAALIPETIKEEEVETTENLVMDAAKAMVDYSRVVTPVEATTVLETETLKETVVNTDGTTDLIELETSSIFIDGVELNRDDFDLEEERDERRNGVPYVISKAEYDENEDNNEQQVLTYFAQDDTLVDEDEKPFDDNEQIVGQANLRRFGHGSEDPVIVYIRNEKIGTDFEILRSDGSYSEEVLGLTDESLEHSATPRRSRRLSDE